MRRYFPSIFGNAAVKERIGRAIEASALSHALLLVGPDGCGKRTLAREISCALNCERRDDEAYPLPCGECRSCRRIKDGNFTDIMRVCRGDRATIGVDDVRLLKEDAYLSATESSYKAYIIEDAERMTPNAQNALLKILEEPPANVIILLLATSKDKILTTVNSRAQTVTLQRFGESDIKDYLLKHSDKARLYSRVSPELLDGILMSSDGRIGRALELIDDKTAKENGDDRALCERIISAMRHSVPYSELYAALSALPQSRVEFSAAIELLISALRDITLIRLDGDVPLLFYSSRDAALTAAKDLKTKRLLALYEILSDALQDASKNVSVSAIAADLGVKIKFI
ncbi:MAG: AAA family ATPase [Clostridia bacterium]|nr:AAA family ATPase [Clostridia bacterium]